MKVQSSDLADHLTYQTCSVDIHQKVFRIRRLNLMQKVAIEIYVQK